MNNKGLILSGLLCFLTLSAAFGQAPPPNDNYSNRITLSGTDITFSGTLAGATLEAQQERPFYPYSQGLVFATQSIWWSWTASVTSVLNLFVLGSSKDQNSNDALAVYHVSNTLAPPIGTLAISNGVRMMESSISQQILSVPVVAGETYQIQLLGASSADYSFRLLVTNVPIIVTGPRSQTVYSNESTLLYVVAEGVRPLAYQWRLNGTNIADETWPMLLLTNIGSGQAGSYSVLISNAFGSTTSGAALLSASQSNAPPALTAGRSSAHAFEFSLAGEIRSYRIESSTNLATWIAETNFPYSFVQPAGTAIVFNTNSPTSLSIANNAARKFVRAVPYVLASPEGEICVNHLREIRLAKLLWQREFSVYRTATPALTDIEPYFPHNRDPICPNDLSSTFAGSYSMGDMSIEPFCKNRPQTHQLLEAP